VGTTVKVEQSNTGNFILAKCNLKPSTALFVIEYEGSTQAFLDDQLRTEFSVSVQKTEANIVVWQHSEHATSAAFAVYNFDSLRSD
jgi:hypothetical protein